MTASLAPRGEVDQFRGDAQEGSRISRSNAAHELMGTAIDTATQPPSTTPADGAPARVIVVLGYHEIGDDGTHGLSPVCRAALRRAEALADAAPPRAVIFTGWSSRGGPSEADQMAEEWRGRRDIALLREPYASNTAENAVRSLALVQTLEGASEVVLICSIRHFPRVRFFFRGLYRRYGLAIRYRYVLRPFPSPSMLGHELSSITRMARDRRRALRLLEDG